MGSSFSHPKTVDVYARLMFRKYGHFIWGAIPVLDSGHTKDTFAPVSFIFF